MNLIMCVLFVIFERVLANNIKLIYNGKVEIAISKADHHIIGCVIEHQYFWKFLLTTFNAPITTGTVKILLLSSTYQLLTR